MFYPTTCVGLRYGFSKNMLSGFSWEPDYHHSDCSGERSVLSRFSYQGGFACLVITYAIKRTFPSVRGCVTSPSPHRSLKKLRNLDRMSIGCALRLSLRSRLTLIRLALIRNPWSYGVGGSRPHYRYLYLHLLFRNLQHGSRLIFCGYRNAPLPICH